MKKENLKRLHLALAFLLLGGVGFGNVIDVQAGAYQAGDSASAVGENATAVGNAAKAYHQLSTALGNSATVGVLDSSGNVTVNTGAYGLAVGNTAVVTADYGTAIGNAAKAYIKNSTAIGYNATVGTATTMTENDVTTTTYGTTGVGGIAIGNYVDDSNTAPIVTADYGIAIGTGATVNTTTATKAIALGYGTSVTEASGIALGDSAKATNTSTIAIGESSQATKTYSTAIGANTTASGMNSVAIGGAKTVTDAAHVTKTGATALGGYSVAIGNNAKAENTASIALGSSASALSDFSVAIGNSAKAMNAERATAVGNSSYAYRESSSAFGSNAAAYATRSLALGKSAKVGSSGGTDGIAGVAIGESAVTSANYGVSLGAKTQALGVNSIAIGGNATTGAGNAAYAQGANAIAIGNQSRVTVASGLALGENASVAHASSVAIGQNSATSEDNSVSVGASTTSTRTITNVTKGNSTKDAAIWDQIAKESQTVELSTEARGEEDTSKKNTIVSNDGTLLATFAKASIVSGNTGFVSGGDLFSEVRVTGSKGTEYSYIDKNNTTAKNLEALDEALAGSHYKGSDTISVAKENDENEYTVRVKYMATSTNIVDKNAQDQQLYTVATGVNAMALGVDSQAIADYALAMGPDSMAKGKNSVAIGSNAWASYMSGDDENETGATTAIGYWSNATGNFSTAVGAKAKSWGEDSAALGVGAEAYGNYSSALGTATAATGEGASALGGYAATDGNAATAVGYSAKAVGEFATATGAGSATDGARATALGAYSRANADKSLALGALSWASEEFASATGYNSHAMGTSSTALGVQSAATAEGATAIGYQSVAATAKATETSADGTITADVTTVSFGHKNNDTYYAGFDDDGNPISATYNDTVLARLTNMAEGKADTDGVNFSQIKTVARTDDDVKNGVYIQSSLNTDGTLNANGTVGKNIAALDAKAVATAGKAGDAANVNVINLSSVSRGTDKGQKNQLVANDGTVLATYTKMENIADDDYGFVSGHDLWKETRENVSGDYIAASNTAGANLNALDAAIGVTQKGHYISAQKETAEGATGVTNVATNLTELDQALYEYSKIVRVGEENDADKILVGRDDSETEEAFKNVTTIDVSNGGTNYRTVSGVAYNSQDNHNAVAYGQLIAAKANGAAYEATSGNDASQVQTATLAYNDESSNANKVKISIAGEGTVAANDARLVNGGTMYTELRPTSGNYIADQATKTNLASLDAAIGKVTAKEGETLHYIDAQDGTATTTGTVNVAYNLKQLDSALYEYSKIVRVGEKDDADKILVGRDDSETEEAFKNVTTIDVSNGGTNYRTVSGVAYGTDNHDAAAFGQLIKEATAATSTGKDNVQTAKLKFNDSTISDLSIAIEGQGEILDGDKRLLNGDTVYDELRPVTSTNYVAATNTTAVNLSKLDAAIGQITGTKGTDYHYINPQDGTTYTVSSNLTALDQAIYEHSKIVRLNDDKNKILIGQDEGNDSDFANVTTIDVSNGGTNYRTISGVASGKAAQEAVEFSQIQTKAGTGKNGTYLTSTLKDGELDAKGTVGANLAALDAKAVSTKEGTNAINLSSTGNKLVSNDGTTLATFTAGSITENDENFISGKTVYDYSKPVAKDGYTLKNVSETASTGVNLGLLDAAIVDQQKLIGVNDAKTLISIGNDAGFATVSKISVAKADGTARTISGVANGSALTDAVNVSQLNAIAAGNVKTGQEITLSTEARSDKDTSKKNTIVSNDGTVLATFTGMKTVAANDYGFVSGADLYKETRLNVSGNYVAAANSAAVNFNRLDAAVGVVDKEYTFIKKSLNAADATKNVSLAQNLIYLDEGITKLISYDSRTKAIQIGGGYTTAEVTSISLGGRKVTGVANGVANTDAVNVSQLNAVDAKVTQNATDIGTLKTDVSGLKTNVTNLQTDVSNLKTEVTNKVTEINTTINNKIGTVAKVDAEGKEIKYQAISADNNVSENLVALDKAISSGVVPDMEHIKNVTKEAGAEANEDGAIALGTGSNAGAKDSISFGTKAEASQENAMAFGTEAKASATGALSFGNQSAASSDNALAFGSSAAASADSAVAIGNGASASGQGSVAIGSGSVAKEANVISVGSEGNERKIVNVAAGVNDTDAVNVSQLKQSFASIQNTLTDDINRVGAGAAALSALRPEGFDPADKISFAVGFGHYRNANATAVGAFFKPNADMTISLGGTIGNGDPLMNAGVSFKLGARSKGPGVYSSNTELVREVNALRADNKALKNDNAAQAKRIANLEADNAKIKADNEKIIADNKKMQEQIAMILSKMEMSGTVQKSATK